MSEEEEIIARVPGFVSQQLLDLMFVNTLTGIKAISNHGEKEILLHDQ